jgi:DNA-binding MarR family transcriptional regulator|tara:strand:- start:1642 stop:2022 length:381 start_codon:yes stop_codon:yes gene_type:complete
MALKNKELGCCGDLSLNQCHLLLTIAELREAGVVQLAERLGLDKSTLSRSTGTLVNKGFIKRCSNTRDGRVVHLILTSEGRKTVSLINRNADKYYESLADKISLVELNKVEQSLNCLVDFFSQEDV